MRQQHEPLVEIDLLLGGRDEAVGENVLVIVGAERAGKADAVDLYRRRTQRKDFAACRQHIAARVEQDRDAILAYALCRLFEALGAHIDEVIESSNEASAGGTSIIGPERV